MSLLMRIREPKNGLTHFLCEECKENNIAVKIDDAISPDDIAIIKPDNYYNSLKLGDTPKAPDCLIVQRCGGVERYRLTIVELKKTNSSSRIDPNSIDAKFRTCFEDFMSKRFRELFDREYDKINIYLVSRVGNTASLHLEVLMEKRYTFRGKRYGIQTRMPDPILTSCS